MESPNNKQISGSHYKGGKFQHWDWWIINRGVDGLAYAATKYVCRWRSKGGVRDLEKALHYVEKIEEAHTQEAFPVPWPRVRMATFMQALQRVYQLNEMELAVCEGLASYGQRAELCCIKVMLQELIKKASAEAEAANPKHL